MATKSRPRIPILRGRGVGAVLKRDTARARTDFVICILRGTSVEHHRMQHNSDYYREEAAKYRELADMTKDAITKQELLELAAACEGIADKFDDLRDKRIMSNCIMW